MPAGNDFGPIDANVEIVTLTMNFDPWLAVGLTIVAILSVTASNAEISSVTDPNPNTIVIPGSPQIVAAPPPPIGCGQPARAVVFQVSNLQPNVIYLLQCLARLSDGQVYNLTSHVQTNVPV